MAKLSAGDAKEGSGGATEALQLSYHRQWYLVMERPSGAGTSFVECEFAAAQKLAASSAAGGAEVFPSHVLAWGVDYFIHFLPCRLKR